MRTDHHKADVFVLLLLFAFVRVIRGPIGSNFGGNSNVGAEFRDELF